MLKIDNGIPVPPLKGRRRTELGASISETLRALNPGQSVFFAGRDTHDASAWMSRARAESPQKRFTSRTEGEGVRIWRIDDAHKVKTRPSDLFR